MKFLIQDYSTLFHTEPKYFNHILNNIDGCSSVLWDANNNISVYDTMDTVKPSIVLTHASVVHKDLILYLSENQHIDLILNISGITQEDLKNIENIFTKYNITSSLCFVNYGEHYFTSSRFNIVSIYHGADIFLPQNNQLNYAIDKLYVTYNDENIEDDCSYHVFSNNVNIKDNVDAVLAAHDLGGLYKNYETIIINKFPHANIIPQTFFDIVFYGKNILYNVASEQMSEICRILKVDNLKDVNKIKSIIKEKHTCLNRTKSLLSQLKCSDLVSNLSQMMKEVI